MQQSQSKQQVGGILGFIERIGNKIPDITILFISAFLLVCVVSAVFSADTFQLCASGDRQAYRNN